MKENWPLIAILVVLTIGVLVSGGLAVHLTLARAGGEATSALGESNEQAVAITEPTEPHIAYVSDLEEGVGIYVMDTDGSNPRRVSAEGFYWNPSWSPDGRLMAYGGARESFFGRNEAFIEVWVAAIDGSERITVSQAISDILTAQPAWSPDGTALAFLAVGEAEDGDPHVVIHIAQPDGSGIVRAIPLPWMTYSLNWSPKGDAFLLVSDVEENESSIYVLSFGSDDEDPQLTEVYEGAVAADWSPDGEQIAVGDYSSNAVLLIEEDQEPSQVIQLNLDPVEIAWSPDGAHLAIATAANYRQGYGTNLYLVDVESGEYADIAQGQGWVVRPGWSPDGSHLLFTMGPMVQRTGSDLPYADLWVYDVASSGLMQLTGGGGFEGLGEWSP